MRRYGRLAEYSGEQVLHLTGTDHVAGSRLVIHTKNRGGASWLLACFTLTLDFGRLETWSLKQIKP
jgi:hypothetical protein